MLYLATMARILDVGERFPDFVLASESGTPTNLYSRVGGRPTLVILHRDPVEGLVEISERMGGQADVVSVSTGAPSATVQVNAFLDSDGRILDVHLDQARFLAYILDTNLRVIRHIDTIIDIVEQVRVGLARSDRGEGTRIESQAPVLTISRVLEQSQCDFLVQLWGRSGSVKTGVERSTDEGRGDVLSAKHKVRRDHTVEDPKLIRLLTQSIGKRVLSEVERAFIYRPTHFEGFKIACYEADSSGFFGPHRDNLSSSTAHRRLAVSMNLNHGYVGGELQFPEFGLDRYCPKIGDAVVFSCSHLHEVLPVTSGKRFTLLTFLYDSSAEREHSVDPFAV
jgi:predicted 2-oxoglutarate/Fe(II)-dependent dioxygenase YbiX